MLDRHKDTSANTIGFFMPSRASPSPPTPTLSMDLRYDHDTEGLTPGEKKGQVKAKQLPSHEDLLASATTSSSSGRKRRLSHDDDDTDYVPAAQQPPKRHHVAHDDKQLQLYAGCTDEWQPEQPPEQEDEQPAPTTTTSSTTPASDDVPRPAPRTWVAKVEWALGSLGGKGTLADIYAIIEDAFPEEVDGKRNWKAAIRSCLSKNEKLKFFKPSSQLATKDHLWCLAPSRPRPPTKRGRPAGRGRRASSARAEAQNSVLEPSPSSEEQHAQELNHPPTEQASHDEEIIRDGDRRGVLLQQKQQLEDEITRLLHTMSQDGQDGLSADQEDFLRELLG